MSEPIKMRMYKRLSKDNPVGILLLEEESRVRVKYKEIEDKLNQLKTEYDMRLSGMTAQLDKSLQYLKDLSQAYEQLTGEEL